MTHNVLLDTSPVPASCTATVIPKRDATKQLMKQGGGDDEQLCAAWGQVGAYYTERGKWGKAVQYFKQAKDLGMMAECYYRWVGGWVGVPETSLCRSGPRYRKDLLTGLTPRSS